MARKFRLFIYSCLIAFSFSVFALAQSGGGFDLTWSSIDGGGATNTRGWTFTLSGTIGQPDAQAAPVMSGGSFTLTGGFWPGAGEICSCPGDLTGDGKKDGRDIQQFVFCVLTGGNCSC